MSRARTRDQNADAMGDARYNRGVNWRFLSHAWPAEAPVVRGSKAFHVADRELVWARGTLALRSPHLGFWGSHAVSVEPRTVVVVAAAAEAPIRLELEDLVLAPRRVVALDGTLHIASTFGTMEIALADLERLTSGVIAITIETLYPLRNAKARVAGVVSAITGDVALVNVGRSQLELDAHDYGLERGMEVALADELWPGSFAAIDVPQRPRQVVIEPLAPYTIAAKVSAGRAEPTLAATTLRPLARRAELDHLIREIAAHPEDDQNRAVLIDLLADLGEPCAALFARARAGNSITVRKRGVAFGPLVHYFKPIELVRGLPHTATLSRTAPDDELATLLGDIRLGLLSRVRLGRGSLAIYKTLVAARELVGLRRIDAPNASVVLAAVKGGHRLTHLDELDLSDPLMANVLGQRELDSVRHFALHADRRDVAVLVRRLVHDFHDLLARAPRHLTFIEPQQFSIALAHSVIAAFPALAPGTVVTIGGITLHRAGEQLIATVAEDGNPQLADVLHEVLPEAVVRGHPETA
jgi:hypothetical protein